MKTILIPVDFSETSSSALKYTLGLIKDLKVGKIILLKTFTSLFMSKSCLPLTLYKLVVRIYKVKELQ
jgi:hypothetical protein